MAEGDSPWEEDLFSGSESEEEDEERLISEFRLER